MKPDMATCGSIFVTKLRLVVMMDYKSATDAHNIYNVCIERQIRAITISGCVDSAAT